MILGSCFSHACSPTKAGTAPHLICKHFLRFSRLLTYGLFLFLAYYHRCHVVFLSLIQSINASLLGLVFELV